MAYEPTMGEHQVICCQKIKAKKISISQHKTQGKKHSIKTAQNSLKKTQIEIAFNNWKRDKQKMENRKKWAAFRMHVFDSLALTNAVKLITADI